VANSKCSAFASYAILHYFSLQTRQFLLVGAQKYFLPLATPLLILIIDIVVLLLILTTHDIDS